MKYLGMDLMALGSGGFMASILIAGFIDYNGGLLLMRLAGYIILIGMLIFLVGCYFNK